MPNLVLNIEFIIRTEGFMLETHENFKQNFLEVISSLLIVSINSRMKWANVTACTYAEQ